MFENRMPRIIFGPEKKEVMGGRKKLLIEEPHNMQQLADIVTSIKSWRMDFLGKCSLCRRDEIFVWNSNQEGRNGLEDIGRWEDNITMDHKEKG